MQKLIFIIVNLEITNYILNGLKPIKLWLASIKLLLISIRKIALILVKNKKKSRYKSKSHGGTNL